jgi:hypothetical protein
MADAPTIDDLMTLLADQMRERGYDKFTLKVSDRHKPFRARMRYAQPVRQ